MDALATAVSEPVAPALESTPAPVKDSAPIAEAIKTGDTAAFKEERRKERLELKGLLKTEDGPKPREAKPPAPKPVEKEKNAGAKQRIQQLDPEIQEL